MTIQYENLELIPTVLAEIKALKDELVLLKSYRTNFKTATDVCNFLEISKASYYNYKDKGALREGTHYRIKNGKTVFIEEGIIDFKKTFVKHSKDKSESNLQLCSFMSKLVA